MSNKKYGLIVPDRGKPVFQASRNVFGNDSDSEEESNKKPMLLRPSDNTTRQAKITQEKAVLEDPTVYQYDEIYDDMTSKKEKVKVKSKEEKKPQYIEKLMKAANKRKVENERRIERQIQKEREKEGDEFQDKEVFVTSAYKKKLEEMRLEEEKEKREEYLENIGDVTKQSDLGGFYRHLYEQKMGTEDKSIKNDENDSEANKEAEAKENDVNSNAPVSNTQEAQKKRNYRKRKSSDTQPFLSEGEIQESDEEINRVNLDDIRNAKKNKQEENIDADSDFSIDESSDEDEDKKKEQKQIKNDSIKTEEEKPELPENDKKTNVDKIKEIKDKKKTEEPKPKVDIWKKRTVGAVFDDALRRYYERKAARGC
ncbi:nuclear speckle splicing regulatory protein 1 [Anticarsia gemmatalis]|uniref:nuclear speckle splicing regulatory protein 1 n=1 Tax=Anticarsia gemmatalis TaxID=129554 RepID=UPI003F767AC2